MAPHPTKADPTAWVDAAPFRAHLAHLCVSTGLPWQVVALYAGVSIRTADRLLHGRRGRRVRRLPSDCGRQLLAVRPASLLAGARAQVRVEGTTQRVRELLDRGVSVPALAASLGSPAAWVAGLAMGRPAFVSRELALRVQVLRETVDRAALHAVARAA